MTLILNPPQRSPRRTAVDPHRDAKARLQAALAPDLTLKRTGRDHRILLGLAPISLLPFAGAAVLAMLPPAWPADTGDWRQWIDPAGATVFALVVAAVFARGLWRVMNQWDNSAPDTPEAAMREFYRAAMQRRPRARRLAGLLRGFDTPGPPPKPVLNWMTAAAIPKLDSAKAVARYWRALLRGNGAVVHRARIIELVAESPMPDVGLGRVRFETSVVRRVPAFVAVLAGTMVAAAPFIAGPQRLAALGVPFWGAVASAVALGAGLAWLLRKLNRTVLDRREIEVHKLLVRAGHNWRVISGEWETSDEADLEWLLHVKRA
ncbi:MAG: hypothetical protein KF696_14235 [Planctomycetes bacterium]|nr:hypothetical protein [Planctomycetota bacterium]MCW8136846.1 hypothetical protein [Planctomycetota bacterium]